MARRALGALLCFGWASCAVGPDYQRPELPDMREFRGADGATVLVEPQGDSGASIADLPWWEMFQDPSLVELLRQAMVNNYDVNIAVARVEQAAGVLRATESQFFPQLGYTITGGRGERAQLGAPSGGAGGAANSMAGYGSANWQIDLWGKIRRQAEAARASLFSTEYARRGVMLTVVGSVATSYYTLLQLDQQVKVADEMVEAYQQTYDLFERRLVGGWASALETAAAAAQLHSVAAESYQLKQERTALENAINVLVGRAPGPVKRDSPLSRQRLPPVVPAGLPSQLVERRPDLLQAEQALVAATANIGVAIANYFPELTLTGLLGVVSTSMEAITAGNAWMWGAFGGLSGPLYTFGGLEGAEQQAVALAKEASLSYKLAVLNAFKEVSDTLSNRHNLARAYEHQWAAVQSLEDAVRMATERYRVGSSSYYEVLQELELMFPAKLTLASLNAQRFNNVVSLYLALGGGWDVALKDWKGPRPRQPQSPGGPAAASRVPP